jgi:hypothetical protein
MLTLSDEFHASDENLALSKTVSSVRRAVEAKHFGSHHFDGADCEFAKAGKAV